MISIFKSKKDTRIPKRISANSPPLISKQEAPIAEDATTSKENPLSENIEDSESLEKTEENAVEQNGSSSLEQNENQIHENNREEIAISSILKKVDSGENELGDKELINKKSDSVQITVPEEIDKMSLGVNKSSANTPATSPVPQRLLFKMGLNEDEEETTEATTGADSPLIFRQTHYTQYNIVAPSTPGLNRISTCNSSLAHISLRQDNRSRYRPGATRKTRRRAILKNGDCNILQSRISKHRLRFLQDIFTTLVDTQWRWTLIVFALSFLLSWLGFAVIWWLISFTHGDFELGHLPDMQETNGWKPCVSNIFDFTSCFLFSIETQHTIGYGFRTTSEECPEAIFVMCMQSICGVMIQAFMVGIVFAKMTRPKHRTQTLLFSRNAVICQRDGSLCLMFRVGDMRKSHIIGASIRAQLIRPKTTKEGEILTNYQTELAVNADGCDGDLFFIWPMTVVHKIDDSSPLYHLSAADMLQDRFEIVVILEGTIESTGQTTQARSSYVAAEVLWGHRFEPVVSYNKDRQGYEVKYSKFDNTLQVDTPLCSGAELAEFYRMQEPVGYSEHIYLLDDGFYRYSYQESNSSVEEEEYEDGQVQVIVQQNYLPPEPEEMGVQIEDFGDDEDIVKNNIQCSSDNIHDKHVDDLSDDVFLDN